METTLETGWSSCDNLLIFNIYIERIDKIMFTFIAKLLVGPFNRKEMSWKDYKWFRDRVADNLKRITIKFIILMMIIISIIALVYSFKHPQRHGHYEPDYVSKDGQLIDIDHDGDTYKWVWDD